MLTPHKHVVSERHNEENMRRVCDEWCFLSEFKTHYIGLIIHKSCMWWNLTHQSLPVSTA